jgi:eukaryotic-like serine/threonine-protein kinase
MPPDPQKARELFLHAVGKLPPERWEEFVAEGCGGDAELNRHVSHLLQVHRDAGSFLESPAVAFGDTGGERTSTDRPAGNSHDQSPAQPGTVIGPYKLLQPIGEGGMGTVYMAEQVQPVRRTVALKLIKAGMDSRLVLARFGAERQALALMDHPSIAKVLDAGATAEGRPYFVMELVKGIPITKFCDERQLTLRERLELAIPVCQAVQHAHQKGIIHRDLKPSNVLIALYDDKPVPKVIDFGVAKATGPRLTDQTLYTEFGAVVGTLEYMSPEQAQLNQLDIDTRSDIYSLGVLLYELLTGSTPLDRKRFKETAFLEVLRVIREEESPQPSVRLSMIEGLPSIAACRNIEPRKLSGLLRGELDWIVMKALEKDRNRRYETANDLAADLRHYLDDEPVQACPPSAGYRLRKLVRRHRGPVLAAALMLLALLAGVVGTTCGLIRANQALQAEAEQRALAEANERKALEQKRIAEAVRTFLQQDLLRQADATEQANAVRQTGGGFETIENPTIKELLNRAAAELMPGKIEAKFPQQPQVQASILRTVGATYWGIGEYARAVDFLKRSSDIYRHTLAADHPDTLATLEQLAGAYLLAGRMAEAVALYEQVRDVCVKKLGPDHPQTLITLHGLAGAYLQVEKAAEAVALCEQVRDARVKTFGTEHPQTLATLYTLAEAYRVAGRTAEAIALCEQVRDSLVKSFGADHPETLGTLQTLAEAYRVAGKTAEAIALLEQVRDTSVKKLGSDHPLTLMTMHSLVWGYLSIGNTAEAVALCEHLRDVCVKKLGDHHPLTLIVLNSLAGAYLFSGKTSEAVALYELVRDMCVKTLGADRPQTLVTLGSLAKAYLAVGRQAEAIALFEQVRDVQIEKLGADHPQTLAAVASLALAFQAAGKPEQALPLLQQAAAGFEKRQFVDSDASPIVGALIVDYHERLKQYDQAEVWQRKWMAVVKERYGADSLPYATEMAILGMILLRQKKWTDAEAELQHCLAIREKRQPDDWTTFAAQSMLGEALNGQKKRAEAEPLLVQGYEGLRQRAAKIPKERRPRLAEAMERLVQFYDAWGKPDEAARWRRELNPAAPKTKQE